MTERSDTNDREAPPPSCIVTVNQIEKGSWCEPSRGVFRITRSGFSEASDPTGSDDADLPFIREEPSSAN